MLGATAGRGDKTAYWGTKPEAAKLTKKGNSQVLLLYNRYNHFTYKGLK